MKSKKDSLLILTPSFSGGGAEKVAVNLANQYASDGIDVTLLVVNPKGPYRSQVTPTVKVVDLNCLDLRTALIKIFKALKNEKPENILSMLRETNILVGLSRFLLKIDRVVFREASTLNHVYNSAWYKRVIWLYLMRLSYSKADKIIANSRGTRKHLIENKIVKSKNIEVIDNPVVPSNVNDLKSFKIGDPWINDPALKVILNVARLHIDKNQSLLIKAFAKVEKEINNTRLIIIGEGVEQERLEKLAASEGVAEKVRIISFQSNPYPYYYGSDVFVLSSDYEGFGNVVVEALSTGTPVVSTNCPGGPYGILMGGEFGALTEVGDSQRLSSAILDVLKGNLYFESSDLVNRSAEYSIDNVSKKYWSLFDDDNKY